ncbi:MAG: alpha/beta hydrolase, partial [Planctomycetota bacterium]
MSPWPAGRISLTDPAPPRRPCRLRKVLRLCRRGLLGLIIVLLSAPAALLVAEEIGQLIMRPSGPQPPVLLAWSLDNASCPGPWRRTTLREAVQSGRNGPLVLLIPGLDEPGSVWDDVATPLTQAGWRLLRFDYPDDQPLLDSAAALQRTLNLLAEEGVEQVRIVAHSMGGLVAWGALQSPDQLGPPLRLPRVRTLVLIAVPLWGSPWAHLRPFAEARDALASLWTCSIPAPFSDGAGQASLDLAPLSDTILTLHRQGPPRADRIVALAPALLAGASAAHPQRLASLLGDGAVPTAAMTAPWVDEVVPLR